MGCAQLGKIASSLVWTVASTSMSADTSKIVSTFQPKRVVSISICQYLLHSSESAILRIIKMKSGSFLYLKVIWRCHWPISILTILKSCSIARLLELHENSYIFIIEFRIQIELPYRKISLQSCSRQTYWAVHRLLVSKISCHPYRTPVYCYLPLWVRILNIG